MIEEDFNVLPSVIMHVIKHAIMQKLLSVISKNSESFLLEFHHFLK